MFVCDDEWNWPSFLALPINSVLFEECTRNGLIKCAMMLLWLLPARVSLLTFAGSTRRWCYEMLQVMQYFSNSQVTIWAAETLPEMTPSIKLQITFLFRLLAAARRDQFFFLNANALEPWSQRWNFLEISASLSWGTIWIFAPKLSISYKNQKEFEFSR